MKKDLSKETRTQIAHDLQAYMDEELEVELGDLGADLFVDFIEKSIGNYFYNQGLEDAQNIIEMKMEDIKETLYAAKI